MLKQQAMEGWAESRKRKVSGLLLLVCILGLGDGAGLIGVFLVA